MEYTAVVYILYFVSSSLQWEYWNISKSFNSLLAMQLFLAAVSGL